jgi:hypothetical protein
MTAPGEAIDVITRLGIAHEDSVGDHAPEIFGSLGIDGLVVGIGGRIEIDFRLRDVQKAPRLALGAFACFCAGQYVVWRCQNLGSAPRSRP